MVDIQHYIEKLLEHEEYRASTNERNDYWKKYQKAKKYENK
jgi:hypothetical protein